MSSFHTLIAATALTVFCAQTASAAEITVPGGRESAINFVTGVTPNCRTIPKPTMRIVAAPEHGALRFQWTKYKIQNVSRICDGKPAWGMVILFKPAPGFHGKDSFKVGVSMPRYEGRSDLQYHQDTVDVLVK